MIINERNLIDEEIKLVKKQIENNEDLEELYSQIESRTLDLFNEMAGEMIEAIWESVKPLKDEWEANGSPRVHNMDVTKLVEEEAKRWGEKVVAIKGFGNNLQVYVESNMELKK